MMTMPSKIATTANIAIINNGCSLGFFSRCFMLGLRIGASTPLSCLLSVWDLEKLLLMFVVSSVDGLPMIFVELGSSVTSLTLGVAPGAAMVR